MRGEDGAQRLAADIGNMVRAGFALTLNQRVDDLFAHAADVPAVSFVAVLILLFAADIGGVRFDDLARAAQGTGGLQIGHSLAQAVHHEPSGLIGDANRAMDLVSGNALLAGIEQMGGKPPLREGYL